MRTFDYLLNNSEIWLQYAIRVNLLNEKKEELVELKNKALQDDKIKNYLEDIAKFHEVLVRNHKDPDLPIHKLLFLLDIGFDVSEPKIEMAITQIMAHKDEHGVYQSLTNIPKHYGGKGEDTFGWCLCDAPLLLLALLKAKVDFDKHIKKGVDYLVSLHHGEGFSCSVSSEHGKFRGPGRKDDCCPYAMLVMLRLFSLIPEYQNSEIANGCVETMLSLWENSMERHPYMFYMGTDFRKLKAPSLWYDIVSVSDCLSKFECVKQDKRFQEMIAIIRSKQTVNGLFIPEAVYQKFKEWDFGQKKKPSPYLTYLCEKIFQQI
ncbi:MAG: hypothetical protein FWC33_07010 [Candidatus Bathyarchaeota archaeon]|nr:hypothetical protein [Candidatus Termiticorpusculum sp.]